ncbi:MAG: hypothetical protein NZ528_10820 [Caldilineales bacterium]|nr:hypothetical protein [Caldilineales bacterium]MDW8317614.1 cyclic nucleotide-binding protein [Anaerolineae bacterium]
MTSVVDALPDALGLAGVVCILLVYFLTQSGRLAPEQLAYSLGNLLGSSLILFSLFFDWNLASVVVEAAWVAISLYGVARYLRRRRRR